MEADPVMPGLDGGRRGKCANHQAEKMVSEGLASLGLHLIKEKKPVLQPVFSRYDYYSHLGFACKAEFKLEKATRVPLRFRLGALQQTDYMEQKPSALKP